MRCEVLLVKSKVVVGVLILRNYIPFFAGIVLGAMLLFFLAREPYCLWITGQVVKQKRKVSQKVRVLNILQLGFLGVYTFGLVYNGIPDTMSESELMQVVRMTDGVPLLVIFVPFLLCLFLKGKNREERKLQMLWSFRNFLLVPATILLTMGHSVSYYSTNGSEIFQKLERWDSTYVVLALAWVVLVVVLAKLAEKKLFGSETNRVEE